MQSSVKWLGWTAVVIGSFLPLVHVPIIGNWNYWRLDHNLAIFCWVLSAFALLGILLNRNLLLKVAAIALILFFIFSIAAIKVRAMDTFSFVLIKSLQRTLAGVVKLRWGWFIEFAGALVMIYAARTKKVEQ